MNHKMLIPVIVKYLPPTDHKGSRIKMRFGHMSDGRSHSITIPYDYRYSSIEEGATHFLTNCDLPPEASTDIGHDVALLYCVSLTSRLREVFHGHVKPRED